MPPPKPCRCNAPTRVYCSRRCGCEKYQVQYLKCAKCGKPKGKRAIPIEYVYAKKGECHQSAK